MANEIPVGGMGRKPMGAAKATCPCCGSQVDPASMQGKSMQMDCTPDGGLTLKPAGATPKPSMGGMADAGGDVDAGALGEGAVADKYA